MSAHSSSSGYSAQVAIELRLGERTVEVAQIGPDFLILSETISHPACEATIVLSVDKTERSLPVFLPEGVSSTSPRVALARVEEFAAVAV